ncbi:MAG TPA: hypothetical protein H9829_05170 [Candidatus Tetragenococcus pullicola]|nr:hypothetical protein [Candidatus Tetragenococcus pullicola]
MTYKNTEVEYRIAFDTTLNLFMAIDTADENHVARGVTIEEAIKNLIPVKA